MGQCHRQANSQKLHLCAEQQRRQPESRVLRKRNRLQLICPCYVVSPFPSETRRSKGFAKIRLLDAFYSWVMEISIKRRAESEVNVNGKNAAIFVQHILAWQHI